MRSGEVSGVEICGITADSRAVRPGFMFAALPGARQDGRRFIGDAVARGAVAVLAPEGTGWPEGIAPRPLVTDAAPRARLARIAADLAGEMPAHIVAVTGTNGKTSTVDFLRQIFLLSGRKAASLGTLGVIALGPGRPLPPGANGFAYQLLGLKPPGGGRHILRAPARVAQLAER